jgi:hypothetical protein
MIRQRRGQTGDNLLRKLFGAVRQFAGRQRFR